MATPASAGAAQMFSPPTIPIRHSGDLGSRRGTTCQGGRARLEGVSRRAGGVASGPPNPSPIG
eukprot:2633352-Pleurochrysis_carterae.AAC.1